MDVSGIKKNILVIYSRREAAALALCKLYAERALQQFRQNQRLTPGSSGEYWDNRTAQAAVGVVADAFFSQSPRIIGWFIAHTVEYGVYLELANDRRFEALRPIVFSLASEFFSDLKEIYGA